ncbi:MAG TPA: branched-chain amino acid ABC transporter substrate-binding protein [Ktedonobacterales bacterium]|nr:branched-chain amino acid ABC transporter substrate-binding protein [Ktedonobacterales bacterium]
MRTWYRIGAVVIGATLALSALAGCGSSGGGTSTTNLVIVTELAVSGTDAGAQLPTQYGADLAIQQNANLGSGYHLSVKHDNYEGTSGVDASIASNNVTQDAQDPTVIAIMGPFNSGVAKVVIPITTKAHLVMISPANTNPGLTKQQYAQANGINFTELHPAGFPEAYFRLPGTDDVQGKVDAQIAAAAPVNAKAVYVVDDDTTYGIGLANYFVSNFTASGGTIAGRTSITATQASSFPSLAATIKSKNPDAVFFGGVTSGGGGLLKKDLVAAGYTNPMVGGDGIAEDPAWITAAGATASSGTYGTVMAPDASTFTAGPAATFLSQYKAAFPGKDITPYSAMAYDATMIEIKAIKSLISAGKSVTREAVRAAVAGIQYTGVTGNLSFDANGDNAGQKVYSVYWIDASTNGQWAFKSQGNIS